MTNLLNDVRYALRQLRRSPGFAFIAILTLALGVGVTTAIFSIVNGLLFGSLHIPRENQIVMLGFQQKGTQLQSQFSLPEYRDFQTQAKNAFSSVMADQIGMDGLSMQGSKPDRILTDYVSGNYFSALGVRPLLGRFFRPSEGNIPGADPIIVLSYAYWKQQFAGDPAIIGRQVSVNHHPVTVIGIAPKDFHGVQTVYGIQAYLPQEMIVALENIQLVLQEKRTSRTWQVYARLQPGVTRVQANATLTVLAQRFATEHPRTERDVAVRAFPAYLGRNGDLDPTNTIGVVSTLFLCLGGMVLLLACVNVANLLLARASVREREMVIRSALGAQRSRLIRQILTESLLLALLGGAAGIGLGLWSGSLLSSVDLHTDVPVYFNFGLDWRVLTFSVIAALLAGIIVGLIPALRLSRANLNLILRESGRGVTRGGNKFRDALVIFQVGCALMLLIMAGLFTRSLTQAERINFGFNPAHVLTLSMDTREIGYSVAQSRDFYRNLLHRIRSLPGVVFATTATAVPMNNISTGGSDTLTVNGYQTPPGQPLPSVTYNTIATDYFRTLEVPLLHGRSFTGSDDEKDLYVAIVSRAMADRFWPDKDPIGKQFVMDSDPTHPMQVVGIAKDARYQGVTGAIPPMFYVPYPQRYAHNTLQSLEVRTAGEPAAIIREVERSIHDLAPALPVFDVQTLRQGLYTTHGLLIFEVGADVAGILGTLGLILAIVGVYGVLSYVVSRKTNEIGIRMAMGAQRSDVLKMVYRQALWIVGVGLACGLVASFAVGHLVRGFIVVSATDPTTYIGVSAILIAIALLACYIPARRAMRIDPVQALREE